MPKESKECCRVLKRYLDGQASIGEVRTATAAAGYYAAAAATAAATAAAYAAYAAGYYAATSAATSAAAAYAAATTYAKAQRRMAKIVRKHYPNGPRLKGA
jgi:hypothetical protein